MKAAPEASPSDEQLIKEYLNGDNHSLGILYQRYYSKVYHKCLSFSRNPEDAFDLAQDVLMKAFSNVESFRGSSKFSTWLYSITSNHCISKSARSKNECCTMAGTACLMIPDDSDDEELEARQNREEMVLKMDDYLNQLPENDRKMLDLKYREDYSIKDLQRAFNLSASAVKMRLLRARHKMEQIIADHCAA